MSCNHGVHASQPLATAVGAPALEPGWNVGRGANGHCPTCGGWLHNDGGCTKCEGASAGYLQNAIPLSRAERATLDEAESLAAYLEATGVDPLNNEGVRRLYENYVSIASGQERRVVLTRRAGTGATDLAGTVYINPHPLGPKGRVIDQLIINTGRVDHELLHELFTPPRILDRVGAIQQGRLLPHLSSPERAIVGDLGNILEDARIERIAEKREPYMWGRILAKHLLEPKDAHARGGKLARLAPYQQVMWAAQIEAQPNYQLTDDIRKGMSPEALDALRAIRPLIRDAVHGTADDALESAVAIAGELRKRGLLPDEPDLSMMSIHQASAGEGADGSISVVPSPGDWPDDAPVSSPSPNGDPGEERSGSAAGPEGQTGGGEAHDDSPGGTGQERCPECGAFKSPGEPCVNPECPTQGGPSARGENEQGSGEAGDLEDDDVSDDEGGGAEAAGGKAADDEGDGAEAGGGQASDGGGDGEDAGDGGDGEGVSGGDGDTSDGEGDGEGTNGSNGDISDGEGEGEGDGDGDTSDDGEGDDTGGVRFPGGSVSPRGDGRHVLTTTEEEELSEEMRQRGEELRRQAEAALRKARQSMAPQYRSAVKAVTKAAERRLAGMVARGPEYPAGSLSIELPFANHTGMETIRTASVRYLPIDRFSVYDEDGFLLASGRREKMQLLEDDRDVIGRGARTMATRLKKMKMRVQKTSYLQKKGQLDRRRLPAVVKGSDRIRMQPAERRDLSMAVSISVDISGSMSKSSRRLGTIVGMASKGLEQSEVPYEVRAYTDDMWQIKSFDQKRISDEQIASMYVAGGQNDDGMAIALGGIALQDREEAARVQFIVTDGEPACTRLYDTYPDRWPGYGRREVKYNVDRNREKGQIVMGIFYAKPSGLSREVVAPKFDEMYGSGNWVYIIELEDLPKVVTETLEAQLTRHSS